jgi:preprotein translocase subunit YajC
VENLFTAFTGIVAQAAQGAQGAQQQQGAGSIWSSLLIMVPIFAIMYFLMIRPQQKKQKEHEEMLSRVKAGDKVMTQGGLYGTVVRVSDNKVTLEIAERVHVEFAQGAIANIIPAETAVEKKEDK